MQAGTAGCQQRKACNPAAVLSPHGQQGSERQAAAACAQHVCSRRLDAPLQEIAAAGQESPESSRLQLLCCCALWRRLHGAIRQIHAPAAAGERCSAAAAAAVFAKQQQQQLCAGVGVPPAGAAQQAQRAAQKVPQLGGAAGPGKRGGQAQQHGGGGLAKALPRV